MWEISKEFDCCYGHRVWSQTLNTEFSLDNQCVCRHLHGHQMKLLVHLEGDELTNGMVTDFKHLNWFKKWVDDVIDHKFIIDYHDPLFDTLLPDYQKYQESFIFDELYNTSVNYTFIYESNGNYIKINPKSYEDFQPELQEMYEGFVIVPFVPTSENISKWMYNIIQEKMSKINVKVSRIEFYETPKSRSQYSKD